MTVALLVFGLARLYQKEVTVCRRDLAFFLLASSLFWVYTLSLLWSTNLPAGLVYIKSHLFLVGVPLIILLGKALLQKKWVLLSGIFLAGICISWLFTIICHFLPPEWLLTVSKMERLVLPYSVNDRDLFGMYSPFITRIQLSNFLAVGCFFALFAYYQRRNWVFVLLGIWCLSGLIFLGGRGGQVGFFSALCLLVVLGAANYGKSFFQKMALVLASLALLALAGYLMVFHMEPVKSRYAQHRYEMEMIRTGEYQHTSYEHFTSLRRIVSWKNSLDLIRKHPLFGTGVGDYKELFAQEYASKEQYNKLTPNNHSQYLHVAGATGIFGLMIWLLCLMGWVGIVFTGKNGTAYRLVAISTLTVFLVAMIPDALLLQQVDLVHFSFLLSWWLWAGK